MLDKMRFAQDITVFNTFFILKDTLTVAENHTFSESAVVLD